MLQRNCSGASYVTKKPSGHDRTAAEQNYAAEATRRRRRILTGREIRPRKK